MQGIASLSSPIYAGQGALQDGAVGTLYTDSDANDILFITANTESHEAKTYSGVGIGRAVVGSFTEAGKTQIAYADGSIYEYQPLFDRFDAVQGFAVEIASGLMATTDVDGDGLDDVISHWHGSVACFSGADFGLVWEHEVDISLQVLNNYAKLASAGQ